MATELSHVNLFFDHAVGPVYTLATALVDCFTCCQGKDDLECDFMQYRILEKNGRRGNLVVRWDALKSRLVVKQATLYPRGVGEYLLDQAVSLVLSVPKLALIQGVVLLNVLEPVLQAKLEARGWTLLPNCIFPSFLKTRE